MVFRVWTFLNKRNVDGRPWKWFSIISISNTAVSFWQFCGSDLGSGIGCFFDPPIQGLTHIFCELSEKKCWVENTLIDSNLFLYLFKKLYNLLFFEIYGNKIRKKRQQIYCFPLFFWDPGWKWIGSRINILDPQHWSWESGFATSANPGILSASPSPPQLWYCAAQASVSDTDNIESLDHDPKGQKCRYRVLKEIENPRVRSKNNCCGSWSGVWCFFDPWTRIRDQK
jgi:hypothetical protein